MRSKAPVCGTPVGPPGHVVVDSGLQLGEVDFGVERADVAGRERLRLADSRQQAGFAVVSALGRSGHRLLRVEAERDVEEGRRSRCRRRRRRAGSRSPARPGAGSCWSRRSTGPRRRRGAPSRCPGSTRCGAPATVIWRRSQVDADARRRPGHDGAGDRVGEHGRFAVDGEEVLRRRAHVGAEGERMGHARRAADRDRRRDEVRVFERVERDPERRRRSRAA